MYRDRIRIVLVLKFCSVKDSDYYLSLERGEGPPAVGSCSSASMFSRAFSYCFLSVFCFVHKVGLLADGMMAATWNRSSSGGGMLGASA